MSHRLQLDGLLLARAIRTGQGIADWIPGRRKRGLALALGLALTLLPVLTAWADEAQLAADLTRFQKGEARIEGLLEALEEQAPEHRDALRYRIDQRLLDLIVDLDAVALRLAEAEPELQRSPAAQELIVIMDRVLRLAGVRVQDISDRITEARAEITEFDPGLRSSVQESFVQQQQLLRNQYLRELIEHLQVLENLSQRPAFAEAFDISHQRLREVLEAEVDLLAERTAGQIRLDTTTLVELRSRLAEAPLDPDLGRAVDAVQRKQSRSLDSLQAAVELLEMLNLDAAEYRALIVRQRGVIGIELLQRQVFAKVMRDQLESAQQRLVSAGPNMLLRAVIFLIILVLAWLLAGLARKLMRAFLSIRHVTLTRLSGEVLVSVIGIVVFLFGLIVALSSLGVSVGPMLAGLGIAGIIIGFALQDSLSNLASGAMILLYQPYDVDDHVRAGDVEGIVRKMNLVATTITTFDNQVLVVPNKSIWGGTIVNHTASRVRRVDIEVSFSYDEDIDFVEQVLIEEMAAEPRVLSKPEATVHIGRWDDSSVTMMAKPWVRTADYWSTLRALTKRFKQRFDAEGIQIPFPQRDVHVYEHGTPPDKPKRSSRALRPGGRSEENESPPGPDEQES